MAKEGICQNATESSFSCQSNFFELRCQVKANDIRYSTRCEVGGRQFLAFVAGTSNLGLYYVKDGSQMPIIKRIPWFQNTRKKITALCFDPSASWLFAASVDGSLYLIPVKTLINEKYTIEQKWTTKDVTTFSSLNAQMSFSRPSALVWWQGVTMSMQTGIIGTEQGEIIFVNLETGKQVGMTRVEGKITSLHICQDTELDTVILLITNQNKEQWRMVLEHPASGYTYPVDGRTNSRLQLDDNDEGKAFPAARSRLRGLKQLSVEKLAILKQKLAESRNRNLESSISPLDTNTNDNYDLKTNEFTSDVGVISNVEPISKCSSTPTAMRHDMVLIPQFLKNGRLIYTRYLASSSFLTIHENSTSLNPIHIHKLPEYCDNILLTHRFFYIVDTRHRGVYVVSRQLSKTIYMIGQMEFNQDSIIARYSFDKREEVINNIYLASSCRDSNLLDTSDKYRFVKDVKDLNIPIPVVDSCIVVTNLGIYKIVLKEQLLSLFMDLILQRRAIDEIGKLGAVFGMNVQQLIEYAGDIILNNKQFNRAILLYSHAGCRLAKTILKVATAGYTVELLNGLVPYLSSTAVEELSTANRIHFSNLTVLAFTELVLRSSSQQTQIHKDFLNFLSVNTFYDELLAANIAGQTNLWNVLHHLATNRGLFYEVLEIIVKALHSFSAITAASTSYKGPSGLMMCASEPSLIQAMLINPNIARNHMSYVLSNLSTMQICTLERLIMLYDPTNVAIRPLLVRCKARRRIASRSSLSSQCDSVDLSEDLEDSSVLVEETIEAFLLTLLTLVHKKQCSNLYDYRLVERVHLPDVEEHRKKRTSVDFKRRLLSTGFAHVAILRNGTVYTWGSSTYGCLGTGPTISQYGTPTGIPTFRRTEIEVLSVSCGRCHTLAVTNNGVYVWGSSKYGQLGLGELLQCPSPELVNSLAQEIIVEAVAGQYHSAAVTSDGRLFTWGWGVHGQLGHGDNSARNLPKLVSSLSDVVVKFVSAGQAHTLALTGDGIVYAFGCNLFGQLGNGDLSKVKNSLPAKVSLLPESISTISTKYFQNLALTTTNKLYVWGASPQVLRLQVRAQKKIRLHQQLALSNEVKDNINDSDISEEETTEQDCTEPPDSPNENKFSKAPARVLEESQGHMKPFLVDTSQVVGKIIQISTGCHHCALLTKDGTVYTWGRNLDGQIGNGSRQEVLIPTAHYYDPASVLANVPPKIRNMQVVAADTQKEIDGDTHDFEFVNPHVDFAQDGRNRLITAVKVSCGSDFTIAIQPGGNVLAWGNNNQAQLGRPPTNSKDEKVVMLRSSKRVIRHVVHIAMETPCLVPNIPAPTISYQSYDVTPLAGYLRPLSHVETSAGEPTVHYSIEQFNGLYDSSKIMNKCLELKNYQACAKLSYLDHNFSEALVYQLKALSKCSLAELEAAVENFEEESTSEEVDKESVQENNRLFEERLEQNLVETLVESVQKQKLKMPTSKSVDSFQVLQEELHTFDCQGGSEELFDDSRSDDVSLDITVEDTIDNDGSSVDILDGHSQADTGAEVVADDEGNSSRFVSNIAKDDVKRREHIVTKLAARAVDFYFGEIEEDAYSTMYQVSKHVINLWWEEDLPTNELEKVFSKHMEKMFYPLSLLLFCPRDLSDSDANRNEVDADVCDAINSLSTKFSLRIGCMLLQHIGEGKPTPEYVEMLSLSMAKNYGPPLTGYPGSSENLSSEQLMDGIISTLSSKFYDPRPFIRIKDADCVSEFLSTEEDSMIFTCGHHFPVSIYQSEVVFGMEAELLAAQPQSLPSTAQLLSSMLSKSSKPETLCPLCIPRRIQSVVKDSINR